MNPTEAWKRRYEKWRVDRLIKAFEDYFKDLRIIVRNTHYQVTEAYEQFRKKLAAA